MIEQCENCSQHQMHTRHDENKYDSYSKQLNQQIVERFPDALVLVNYVPEDWINFPQYSNLIDYDVSPSSRWREKTIVVRRITPRLGALELSTVPAMRPN